MSVSIAFSLMHIFRTGAWVRLVAQSVSQSVQGEAVSLMGMLTNIVPANIVRPLLEGDMLQIMVVAVIIGISTGLAGVKIVNDVFHELTTIFMRATSIFMLIVPLAIFCSVASMIITIGLDTILSILGILLHIFCWIYFSASL